MKLNKHTGEMKLKGPNHWEWFTSHIDALFDCAPDLTAVKDGGSEMIERALGIQHIAVSITYSHTISPKREAARPIGIKKTAAC